MNFYTLLQYDVKSLKQLIKNASNQKEKYHYLFALISKDFLCVLFCFLFVTLFSIIFGSINSTAGVMILLAILSTRFIDFDYNIQHNYIAVLLIFFIEAIGPHFSQLFSLPIGFIINILSLLVIVILSCYKVDYGHHFTFVLGYILLWGSDVNGHDYILRCLGLMTGAIIIIAIMFHQHRNKQYETSIHHVINEFFQDTKRTRWQLQLCSLIALTMLIGSYFHYPKTSWICFTCLSLSCIEVSLHHFKCLKRAPYVIVGCIIFILMMLVLPSYYLPYVGIIGGLCVGVCASYEWQTAFNCLGALAVTVSLFGVGGAIILRILSNIIGTILTFVYLHLFHYIFDVLVSSKFTKNTMINN